MLNKMNRDKAKHIVKGHYYWSARYILSASYVHARFSLGNERWMTAINTTVNWGLGSFKSTADVCITCMINDRAVSPKNNTSKQIKAYADCM